MFYVRDRKCRCDLLKGHNIVKSQLRLGVTSQCVERPAFEAVFAAT